MSLITVKELTKDYHVRNRKKGDVCSERLSLFRTLLINKHKKECVKAVDNITFDIDAGETVGFLGPNGAGKSTVVKMLSGVLVPTSGEIRINGLIPYKDRLNHSMNVGVVFGQRTTLWWDLPLRDSFELLQVIYEISELEYEITLKWLVDILELSQFLDLPVRQLSLGQRMRAELAAALIHRPSVLFLDEPTIGLDIAVKERIRTALKELNRNWNVTILLTTHDLRDIEEICKKLMVIDNGHIMYNGSIDNFRDQYCEKKVLRVAFKEIDTAKLLIKKLPSSVTYAEREGHWVTLYFDQTKCTSANIASEVMSMYPVLDLMVEEPSIEKTVAKFYRGDVQL